MTAATTPSGASLPAVVGAPPDLSAAPVEVELVRVKLALVRPHRAAHGVEAVRDLVLVRVVLTDGTVGWGECSALGRPTYSAEHTAGAWMVLRDELVPALLAGRPSRVIGHPMAVAALVAAEADAHLRRSGRNLADELAALHRGASTTARPTAAVPTTAVVSRGDHVDDLLALVAERIGEGAAMVKVKVTPDNADIDAVSAVRATWPDLALAVDANGTAHTDLMARLEPLGLAYVEQPAPADALVASAAFLQRSDTPVALDESVTSRGSLDAAVALRAGSVLNVKPARVGGLDVATNLVAAATNAGWGVFVGGMLETGIGRAAAAAVAALPGCTLPTDLGPSHRYFEADVCEPLVLDNQGRFVIPLGPGIGRIPDPGRLAAAAVDRLVLSR